MKTKNTVFYHRRRVVEMILRERKEGHEPVSQPESRIGCLRNFGAFQLYFRNFFIILDWNTADFPMLYSFVGLPFPVTVSMALALRNLIFTKLPIICIYSYQVGAFRLMCYCLSVRNNSLILESKPNESKSKGKSNGRFPSPDPSP